ncbi:RNA polymerase sigma factor [Planctomycetota bacterium]
MTPEKSNSQDRSRFSGNLKAWFHRIFDEHYDTVFSYLVSMLRSHADAADVVQDLFVRVIRNPSRFVHSEKLKYYLLAAARKEALRFLSRQSRIVSFEKHLSRSFEVIVAGSHEKITASEKAEECRRLNQALKFLTAEQYEVLMLRLYQELGYREIATMVNAPAETCRSRYRTAVKKLQEKWKHV